MVDHTRTYLEAVFHAVGTDGPRLCQVTFDGETVLGTHPDKRAPHIPDHPQVTQIKVSVVGIDQVEFHPAQVYNAAASDSVPRNRRCGGGGNHRRSRLRRGGN